MKLKIYRTIFCLLIVAMLITFTLIIIKYGGNQLNEQKLQQVVETFASIDTSSGNETNSIQIEGYNVIGLINIPKLKITYPILDIDEPSPESTKVPMKLSIIKYWGNEVNRNGNLSLAGHNNKDGTMFGKTKDLRLGDTIELTDLNSQTVIYKVYNIFNTNPNDVEILSSDDEGMKEVTLITCANGNKERLIIKAKEILERG